MSRSRVSIDHRTGHTASSLRDQIFILLSTALSMLGAPAVGEDKFRIEVEEIRVEADCSVLDAHPRSRLKRPDGLWLIPRIRVYPVGTLAAIEAAPTIVVERAITDTGVDLVASGGLREEPAEGTHIPTPRFKLPRVTMQDGRQQTYGEFVVAETRLRTDSLPTSLARIEGEVRLRVVTDDLWREFRHESGHGEFVVMPGVVLGVDSSLGRPGTSSLWCRIDARQARSGAWETVPVLNSVEVITTNEPSSRSTYAIPIKRTHEHGTYGRTNSSVPYLNCGPANLVVHVVLGWREVRLPFVIENVPVCPSAAPPSGVYGQELSRETVEHRDVQPIGATGEFSLVPLSTHVRSATTPSGPPRDSDRAEVRVALRGGGPGARVGRVHDAKITELTDEHGRPFGAPAAARVLASFVGRGPLPVYWSPGRAAEEADSPDLRLIIPCTTLPRRIGRLRGWLSFEEVTGEVRSTIDLHDAQKWVDIGPGLRANIQRSEIDSAEPGAVTRDYLSVVILGDQALGLARQPVQTVFPVINDVQPINLFGQPCPAFQIITYDSTGTPPRIEVGWLASPDTSAVVLHVVTSVRTRTVPFEFVNLPLTCPR